MNHPKHGTRLILVHVEDILPVAGPLEWEQSAKAAIGTKFKMTDFGKASFILGMDLTRDDMAAGIINYEAVAGAVYQGARAGVWDGEWHCL
mmetsp:Transcript_20850/g.52624  ORF Transcript_20850/g.52624 Transcript_20850/m.52624 type:complete len:91 (+) Transcript_20850:1786-2058(+)